MHLCVNRVRLKISYFSISSLVPTFFNLGLVLILSRGNSVVRLSIISRCRWTWQYSNSDSGRWTLVFRIHSYILLAGNIRCSCTRRVNHFQNHSMPFPKAQISIIRTPKFSSQFHKFLIRLENVFSHDKLIWAFCRTGILRISQ